MGKRSVLRWVGGVALWSRAAKPMMARALSVGADQTAVCESRYAGGYRAVRRR